MKITRTQPQESTGHSCKKLILLLMISTIVIIIAVLWNTKFEYEAHRYTEYSEVVELFEENVQDFDAIVNLLKDNKIFPDMFDKLGYTAIFNPYNLRMKSNKYFTKEEFKLLEDFFLKYRPYEIHQGFDYMQFVMLTGDSNISVSLIYIYDTNSGVHKYLSQDVPIVNITDNWYYRVRK